jgi:sigma-B regulation protein RsbU (phosphoserine phosphatase)
VSGSLESRQVGQADRLSLLYRISQTFNSSLDLDQVLDLVMDEVIAVTHAERGFLMLGSNSRALAFRTARGLDQNTIDSPAGQVSWGVIDEVVSQGKPLLTSNAQGEDRLSGRQSVVFLGLRSVLGVPLQIKGQTIGVIYVDNRIQDGIFTRADLELLTAIASNAAVAIENARLYTVAVEKGRLEREIQLAREVQTRLLANQVPELPGWEFAAQWIPARQVAGDFYDFTQNDPAYQCLVIADVTDKGMPAALYMALSRSIIRASMLHAQSLVEGISYANQLICNDAAYGMFVTLFYARLHLASGTLDFVNAGHNPPLFFRRASGQLHRLTRTGMALGIEESAEYTQGQIQLEPGDFILLYTDGVTEAVNFADQEFGLERLQSLLLAQAAAPARQVVANLQREIEQFAGQVAPSDDITIVMVKRN